MIFSRAGCYPPSSPGNDGCHPSWGEIIPWSVEVGCLADVGLVTDLDDRHSLLICYENEHPLVSENPEAFIVQDPAPM